MGDSQSFEVAQEHGGNLLGSKGAVTNEQLHALPQVSFEQELLDYFRTRHTDILDAIRTTGAIPDEAALEAGIKAFAELFARTEATV